jgi:hypothetical protein
MSTPTAPLPPAAVEAVRRLELALTVPADVARAAARYRSASAAIAIASKVMEARALTPVESSDFEYVQDVMRESRATLAAAGRLDLIEAAS